jgi:3-oxoacyl-[acyl-carrier protein] reductase
MDLGIAGRAALVTAASRGLGRGAARAVVEGGCRVAVCGRDAEALGRAAAGLAARADLADPPGEVLSIPADVTQPDSPRRLVEATVERFGGLHILVANAGGPPPARALEVKDETMLAALNDNLITSIRLVREAVPHMRDAGWGRIVLMTSASVKEPIPTLAYSNTARTGLWAWAKTAAQDLISDGITVNLACPGLHDTDRVRELGLTGRMGDPDDFGKVVAFLCSAPARFLSGAAVQVDGASIAGLL